MSHADPPTPAPAPQADDEWATETGYLADLRDTGRFRVAALLATAVLTWSYVGVLRSVTQVVGGTTTLLPVVVVAVLLAALAARHVPPRAAVAVAVAAVVGGYVYYLAVVPDGVALLLDRTGKLVADAVTLLTGLQVVQITRADVWAVGFAPGPVFLSWYLALRRRYLGGVVVGGLALFVLVLTNDAGPVTTLSGVLAGIAAVGLGELDRRGGTLLQADVLVMLVAVIAVLAPTISLVPGTPVDPLRLNLGGPSTVEGTFVGSPEEMQVVGAIELSTEVRFRVESDEERYWRTGVYDRFTGDAWVRTGQPSGYNGSGSLPEPEGPRREVVQTYRVESQVRTMPGVNQPVEVIGGASEIAEVTRQGTLLPSEPLIGGDEYRVRSSVPDASEAQLRRAGTDYPAAIEERYTQLPASTSSEFRETTAEITAGADSPYEVAERIETHLEETKSYSTEIRKPEGNIANAFLLEMDAGYCTYFATTMVAMLRSEGVPARVAAGYTPGQSVGGDEYVVRGLNSHIWVETYFPDVGWVRFDPTPAGPRERLEYETVQSDGAGGETVPTLTPTTPPTTAGDGGATVTDPGLGTVTGFPGERGDGQTPPGDPGVAGTGGDGADGDGGSPVPLPSGEQTALGALSAVGLAAGAHRLGLGDRVSRAVRLRYQPAAEPSSRSTSGPGTRAASTARPPTRPSVSSTGWSPTAPRFRDDSPAEPETARGLRRSTAYTDLTSVVPLPAASTTVTVAPPRGRAARLRAWRRSLAARGRARRPPSGAPVAPRRTRCCRGRARRV
ncbi:transglutaminase [Halobacteriales archaeon SW_12_71_31]|nr:MAG: transglutaminase [Halobacteriales archaeon SW_12_71_31]